MAFFFSSVCDKFFFSSARTTIRIGRGKKKPNTNKTTAKSEQTNTEETLITSKQIKARLWQRICQKPRLCFLLPENRKYLYFQFTLQILSTSLEFYLWDTFKKNYSYKSRNMPYKEQHKNQTYMLVGDTTVTIRGTFPVTDWRKLPPRTTLTISYSRMKSAVINVIRLHVPPLQFRN